MNNWWDDRDRGRDRERGMLVFGALLGALGLVFLAGEQLNLNVSRNGWPLFVIVPGVVLLVAGLAIPREVGLGLAIPGGIVTAVGLILAFQNATGAWASWAYMWALIAPGRSRHEDGSCWARPIRRFRPLLREHHRDR